MKRKIISVLQDSCWLPAGFHRVWFSAWQPRSPYAGQTSPVQHCWVEQRHRARAHPSFKVWDSADQTYNIIPSVLQPISQTTHTPFIFKSTKYNVVRYQVQTIPVKSCSLLWGTHSQHFGPYYRGPTLPPWESRHLLNCSSLMNVEHFQMQVQNFKVSALFWAPLQALQVRLTQPHSQRSRFKKIPLK